MEAGGEKHTRYNSNRSFAIRQRLSAGSGGVFCTQVQTSLCLIAVIHHSFLPLSEKTVAVYKIVLMFVLTLFSLMKVRVASLILQCREFGVTRADKIPKHYQCGLCKTRVDENQQYKNKTNQLQ